MIMKCKNDDVLRNNENKQNFINMLGISLLKHGFQQFHAEADADVSTMQTAIDCSRVSDITMKIHLFWYDNT